MRLDCIPSHEVDENELVSLTSSTLNAYTTSITIVLIGWPGEQAE